MVRIVFSDRSDPFAGTKKTNSSPAWTAISFILAITAVPLVVRFKHAPYDKHGLDLFPFQSYNSSIQTAADAAPCAPQSHFQSYNSSI
jgi:hypothetical protein